MSDGRTIADDAGQRRFWERVGRVCDGGLESAVARAGGELLGLSVKVSEYDCLLTLRGLMPSGRMIAFVGGDTMASALLKAHKEANSDGLKWRADKYARG